MVYYLIHILLKASISLFAMDVRTGSSVVSLLIRFVISTYRSMGKLSLLIIMTLISITPLSLDDLNVFLAQLFSTDENGTYK